MWVSVGGWGGEVLCLSVCGRRWWGVYVSPFVGGGGSMSLRAMSVWFLLLLLFGLLVVVVVVVAIHEILNTV